MISNLKMSILTIKLLLNPKVLKKILKKFSIIQLHKKWKFNNLTKNTKIRNMR